MNRWWERFWKYKPMRNNQHDWFMVWADIKLSKETASVFHNGEYNIINKQ